MEGGDASGSRRVLVALAAAGNAAQEVLKSVHLLERRGCTVELASLQGGPARLDPVCVALALGEVLWDRTWRLLHEARLRTALRTTTSLRELEEQGLLGGWLDGFDAVLVPGGHGAAFGAFLRDPRLHAVLSRFAGTGRPLALMCHAAGAAAYVGAPEHPLARGRGLVCWPLLWERLLGAPPGIGPYFVPLGEPVVRVLRAAGARIEPIWVRAAVDGPLVTGRGPWSTTPFIEALLRRLSAASAQAS